MSTPYNPGQGPDVPSAAQRGYALPTTEASDQKLDQPIVIAPPQGALDSGDTATDPSGDKAGTLFARRGAGQSCSLHRVPALSAAAHQVSRGAEHLKDVAKRTSANLERALSSRHHADHADHADQEETSQQQVPGVAHQIATDASPAPAERGGSTEQRRRRRKRQRDDVMVPPVEFSSYYGRNIVKPAPWKSEIPTYLYLGGLTAGSALVAAGGEMTGRTELQRNSRLIALVALGGSTGALIRDLGKPSRFLNMLRTVKLTSPMSIGSWILTGFGGFTAAAAFSEVMREILPADVPGAAFWPVGDRLASIGAGAFAAPLAAYTSVLLSDTATPTWHGAYRQMPFVFVGSALAAAGGAAMIATDPSQTVPARRMAIGGAVLEYGAFALMERSLGVCAEPLHDKQPARYLRTATTLNLGGATLTAVAGGRRPVAVAAGLALNVASALTRFGIFEAGMISARDPKYTVLPQRERLEARRRQAELSERSEATTSVTS